MEYDETEYDCNDENDIDNIEEYDNEKQLKLLRSEIIHIREHGLMPSDIWFDSRYEYIKQYSQIGWADMATKFQYKDAYLYYTSNYILNQINKLTEERSTKPTFSLDIYYEIICNTFDVWKHYKDTYIGYESDIDMIDLVEGMMYL